MKVVILKMMSLFSQSRMIDFFKRTSEKYSKIKSGNGEDGPIQLISTEIKQGKPGVIEGSTTTSPISPL